MKNYGEELKKDDTRYCRYCCSSEAEFTKHLGYGEKMGKVFHYRRHCLSCDRTYYVKRDKYVFEKVKDSCWIKSKNAMKIDINELK